MIYPQFKKFKTDLTVEDSCFDIALDLASKMADLFNEIEDITTTVRHKKVDNMFTTCPINTTIEYNNLTSGEYDFIEVQIHREGFKGHHSIIIHPWGTSSSGSYERWSCDFLCFNQVGYAGGTYCYDLWEENNKENHFLKEFCLTYINTENIFMYYLYMPSRTSNVTNRYHLPDYYPHFFIKDNKGNSYYKRYNVGNGDFRCYGDNESTYSVTNATGGSSYLIQEAYKVKIEKVNINNVDVDNFYVALFPEAALYGSAHSFGNPIIYIENLGHFLILGHYSDKYLILKIDETND